MSPLCLSLLTLLGAAPPAAAQMTQAVWHRALVSQSQLYAASTSESFQVSDEILCTALANNAPWCHLLTYKGTTCVLYDVAVDSLDAATPNATTPCRTRHRNVCIVEGAPLPHGATLVHDCQPALCWNRAVISDYTASTTCDGDFVQDALGCVYLHRDRMNWCDARQHCATLGADLATASVLEFPALQGFVDANSNRMRVWVGVRSRMWLDGRDVAGDEWDSAHSDPNVDLDKCAHVRIVNQQLADEDCSYAFIFLCRRRV